MRARLGELARVVRSKNAGPYTLTIDLVFDSPDCAEAVARSLDPGLVARLYRVDPGSVEVILYPPARAVKVNLPRLVPAGHPGDTDVYGAQQHAPLLGLEVEVDCSGRG